MEQARKNLKICSIVVLIYTAASAVQLALGLWFDSFGGAPAPEGSTENVLLITKIVVSVVSALVFLPEIYIGIKGLLIAEKPNSSTRHIFWAKILFVITALAILISVVNLIQQGNVGDAVGNILSLAVELFIYYDYVKYAKLVAKEA